jgi:probable F420-dependent oxidoreductase
MSLAERLGRVGTWAGPVLGLPAAEVRRAAAEIERLGFGSIWFGESFGRECFAQAALLLGATDRVVVGSGIAHIYARDATTMANGGRSLEDGWPGRFILGLGVSHGPSVTARGHEYGRPVSTMRSYLDAMDGARWVGPAVEPPPRVLAALGPRMLELARDRTAGAHPYFVPVEHTRFAREVLGAGPLLVPEQAVVLARDRASAREIGNRHTPPYLQLPNYRNNLLRLGWKEADLDPPGSDALFDAIVAWGDEAAIAERVKAHLDAGADSVLVQPLVADAGRDYLDAVRRLAPLTEL